VLADFFGTDSFAFSLTNTTVGITRSFESFSAAADEAAASRIFAGQHFLCDEDAGQALGAQVPTSCSTMRCCRQPIAATATSSTITGTPEGYATARSVPSVFAPTIRHGVRAEPSCQRTGPTADGWPPTGGRAASSPLRVGSFAPASKIAAYWQRCPSP
jgi:hypothetical protein